MVEEAIENRKALSLFDQVFGKMKLEFDKRYDCEISKLIIVFHPLKSRFYIRRYGKNLCEFSLIYLENANKYSYKLDFTKDLTDKRDLETIDKIKAFVRFRLKFVSISK